MIITNDYKRDAGQLTIIIKSQAVSLNTKRHISQEFCNIHKL